jgi:hypothetical protein
VKRRIALGLVALSVLAILFAGRSFDRRRAASRLAGQVPFDASTFVVEGELWWDETSNVRILEPPFLSQEALECFPDAPIEGEESRAGDGEDWTIVMLNGERVFRAGQLRVGECGWIRGDAFSWEKAWVAETAPVFSREFVGGVYLMRVEGGWVVETGE